MPLARASDEVALQGEDHVRPQEPASDGGERDAEHQRRAGRSSGSARPGRPTGRSCRRCAGTAAELVDERGAAGTRRARSTGTEMKHEGCRARRPCRRTGPAGRPGRRPSGTAISRPMTDRVEAEEHRRHDAVLIRSSDRQVVAHGVARSRRSGCPSASTSTARGVAVEVVAPRSTCVDLLGAPRRRASSRAGSPGLSRPRRSRTITPNVTMKKTIRNWTSRWRT